MRRRSVLSMVLAVVLLFSSAGNLLAAAQESAPSSTPQSTREGNFGARPAEGTDGEPFRIELEAGATGELSLVLSNQGESPVELHSYTSNVYTAINGGLSLEPEGAELTEPATWIEFPSETIALEPGAEETRTIVVTVPEGTAPGQYANAVAVETVGDYAVEGSDNFRQRIRKVLPVFVTVPGDVTASFTVGEPGVDTTRRWPAVQIPVENTGNIRVKPRGEIVVADPTGQILLTMPVVMGYVYAGHSTMIDMPINPPLPPGDYTLDIVLEDEDSGTVVDVPDVAMVMPESGAAQAATITFGSVAVEANADPIQFVNVSVDIVNPLQPVDGTVLTLGVFKDGEHVEDFELDDGFLLQQGTTTVQQRYIPITGFESGTYSFALMLTVEDPSSGASTVLLMAEEVATLEVP